MALNFGLALINEINLHKLPISPQDGGDVAHKETGHVLVGKS